MTNTPGLEQAFSLSLDLHLWQQFGLAFLLGTFTVATLSDLRHLSAQREFPEVWLLFLLAALSLDLYEVQFQDAPWMVAALNWALIAGISMLSIARVGVLFRLAIADVAALAAAASLLSPALVVIFYIEAKLIALVVGPLLARGRPYWPFMPVVSLATLGILLLGFLVGKGDAPECHQLKASGACKRPGFGLSTGAFTRPAHLK
ncbi:MAG: hypothetical protein K2R98_13165 [Gemmataceae bacterium]|nr:hypothetical protein [Gemmataceae bacterium]